MAYKEVSGRKIYPKFGDAIKGDVLVEGIYSREFVGKFGPQYEFESVTGEVVVLGKAGQLGWKMSFRKPGEQLKIIYEGTEIMPSGAGAGKAAHQFTILLDEEIVEGEEPGDQVLCDEGIAEFDNL